MLRNLKLMIKLYTKVAIAYFMIEIKFNLKSVNVKHKFRSYFLNALMLNKFNFKILFLFIFVCVKFFRFHFDQYGIWLDPNHSNELDNQIHLFSRLFILLYIIVMQIIPSQDLSVDPFAFH